MINDLPVEVLQQILLLLEPTSYFNASQVCKRWRTTTRENAALTAHVRVHFTTPYAVMHHESLLYRQINGKQSQFDFENDIYLPLIKQQGLHEFVFSVYKILVSQLHKVKNADPDSVTISRDGTRLVQLVKMKQFLVYRTYDITQDEGIRREIEVWRKVEELPVSSFLSSSGEYVVSVYSAGYMEVVRLVAPDSFKVIYSMQSPSAISHADVSSNGEVLLCRFTRLGGLMLINLKTGEELDTGHYRMDLSLHFQYLDKVLALPGFSETMVFGRTGSSYDLEPRMTLWEHFKSLIGKNESVYVPLEQAAALSKPGTFLGFRNSFRNLYLWRNDEGNEDVSSETDNVREEYEGEYDEDEDQDNEDDDEGENEDGRGSERDADMFDDDDNYFEDDRESDFSEDGRSFLPIGVKNSFRGVDVSYDAAKLVMYSDDSLVVGSLKPKVIDEAFKLGVLPLREIPFRNSGASTSTHALSGNRFAVTNEHCISICESAKTIRDCYYYLLDPFEGLRVFPLEDVNSIVI